MDLTKAIDQLVEQKVREQLGQAIAQICQALATANANLGTALAKVHASFEPSKEEKLVKVANKLLVAKPKSLNTFGKPGFAPLRDVVMTGSHAHIILKYLEDDALTGGSGRATREELVPHTGMAPKSFYSTMAGLVRRGFVRRAAPGIYERTLKAPILKPMTVSAWKKGEKPKTKAGKN